MPSLSAHGVALYYEVHGQGTPILGIHGTPGSALVWVAAARRLGDLGKCVVYDRRGFGRSEHRWPLETVDLADHVDDAAALLDALAATPAIVVGRSTGGLIALELAHRFPDKVRALVLLEPAVVALDPAAVAWAAELRRSLLSAAAVDPGSAAEAVVSATLGEETWDSLPARLREVLADTSPAVLAEARGRGLDLSAEPLELGPKELASIGQPTLLISAESSPEPLHRVNDRLAHALPKSESALVAGGHLIDPADPSGWGSSPSTRHGASTPDAAGTGLAQHMRCCARRPATVTTQGPCPDEAVPPAAPNDLLFFPEYVAPGRGPGGKEEPVVPWCGSPFVQTSSLTGWMPPQSVVVVS